MARVRRTTGPLDHRAQAILRAVIEEYVTTATPVGSQALVERYRLGVSSATVRNVLAELEAAGLLSHPHTSAGRVPTDHGYRFYVESIVEQVPLPPVEQLMIRHQFGQVEFASEHWFRLAASTLAGVTRSAGLATAAKPQAAHIRRIDLVSITDRIASLILVLREGSIKQSLISLDEPADQEELNAVAGRLNAQLTGLTAAAAEARLAALEHSDVRDPMAGLIGERIVRTLREYDATAIEEVFSDGLLNVMAAPEFAQSDKLRRVFSALENRTYLGQLVGARCRHRSGPRLHRRRERLGGDARRVARARAVRPPEPGRRRRRRAGSDPHAVPAGDRHGPLRLRVDERARRPPVCLNERSVRSQRCPRERPTR